MVVVINQSINKDIQCSRQQQDEEKKVSIGGWTGPGRTKLGSGVWIRLDWIGLDWIGLDSFGPG